MTIHTYAHYPRNIPMLFPTHRVTDCPSADSCAHYACQFVFIRVCGSLEVDSLRSIYFEMKIKQAAEFKKRPSVILLLCRLNARRTAVERYSARPCRAPPWRAAANGLLPRAAARHMVTTKPGRFSSISFIFKSKISNRLAAAASRKKEKNKKDKRDGHREMPSCCNSTCSSRTSENWK